jgi:hypothetical protein
LIEAPLALQALAAGQLQTAKMPFITAEKTRVPSEQRSVPRRRVSMGSWIINLDGALVQACQTRDVSARGVRVHFKEAMRLPGTLFYLDMKDRIAYEAAVRWQEKSEAGLEFSKAYRFADMPSEELKKMVQDL